MQKCARRRLLRKAGERSILKNLLWQVASCPVACLTSRKMKHFGKHKGVLRQLSLHEMCVGNCNKFPLGAGHCNIEQSIGIVVITGSEQWTGVSQTVAVGSVINDHIFFRALKLVYSGASNLLAFGEKVGGIFCIACSNCACAW